MADNDPPKRIKLDTPAEEYLRQLAEQARQIPPPPPEPRHRQWMWEYHLERGQEAARARHTPYNRALQRLFEERRERQLDYDLWLLRRRKFEDWQANPNLFPPDFHMDDPWNENPRPTPVFGINFEPQPGSRDWERWRQILDEEYDRQDAYMRGDF